MMQLNETNYTEYLLAEVFDQQAFVRLTMSGVVRDPAVRWQRIVLRPVDLKAGRAIQAAFFDQRQNITKNYLLAEASEPVAEIIAMPFSNITLETTSERVQIQRSKKGKIIVGRNRTAQVMPDTRHNHAKALLLPADQPDAFLQTIGVMNSDGSIKPSMNRKFSQINEFLRAIEQSGAFDQALDRPLRILDCGCGSAYLTFAVYHYLNTIRQIPAVVVGIDNNEYLIRKCATNAHELGFENIHFEQAAIETWTPNQPIDVVLSLHACDTATDDALALAIRADAPYIISVPCCHKDLSHKLNAAVLRPMVRDGLLRQRTADLVTDAFRAQILRILGYRTDVIEFITPDQTSKNLMIRAVKSGKPDQHAYDDYHAMKTFWQVTPYLEILLGAERFMRK